MLSGPFVFFEVVIMVLLAVIFEGDRRNKRILLLPVVFLGLFGLIYRLYPGNSSWSSLALSVAVGGGFFGLQYALSRGKMIGLGDVYLGLALGCVFRVDQLLFVFLMAYVGASMVALLLLYMKRMKRTDPFPLGACLALSAMVTLFLPDPWRLLGIS